MITQTALHEQRQFVPSLGATTNIQRLAQAGKAPKAKPQSDQYHGACRTGGEVGEHQGGAGPDHQRDQQQGVTHAVVKKPRGEHIAQYARHAIQQQQ